MITFSLKIMLDASKSGLDKLVMKVVNGIYLVKICKYMADRYSCQIMSVECDHAKI